MSSKSSAASFLLPAKSAKILVSQRARGGRGKDGDSNFGTYSVHSNMYLLAPQSFTVSPDESESRG